MRLWPNFGRDLILNKVIASILIPRPLRWRLYRLCGARVQRSAISPGMWVGNGNFSVGEDTFINYGCRLNTAGGVHIGARCNIAREVSFVTSSHVIGGPERRAGDDTVAPISIGDGSWIGTRATILPGVEIGAGSVVAAGALVTRSAPPHSVLLGVPAVASPLAEPGT